MHMCMFYSLGANEVPMLQRRLVVLIDDTDHELLQTAARRRGVSVAKVVRAAIRERLGRERRREDDASTGIDFLCEEHDPSFEWDRVKKELVARHAR